MSHQKEAENESGTRNLSWAGDEISLDTDRVNHLWSTNDLRASRALQTGKGVSVGGLTALKSEKTEHEQLSEESGAAHAGFLERWRLPSRSHGHFRRLTKILVTITQMATRGSRFSEAVSNPNILFFQLHSEAHLDLSEHMS